MIARIKKRSLVASEFGTEVMAWVNLGEIEGYMDKISISKGEQASKIVQDSTHIFITYKIVDVKTGDRLIIDGKTYEINYVDNPLMMNNHLEIELKPILEQVGQADTQIYFGFSTMTDIDEMTVLGLNNQLFKKKSFTTDLEITASNLVISYPKSFGKSSIRLNNKLITNWNIKEITVNGDSYFVYITEVTGTNLTIELF